MSCMYTLADWLRKWIMGEFSTPKPELAPVIPTAISQPADSSYPTVVPVHDVFSTRNSTWTIDYILDIKATTYEVTYDSDYPLPSTTRFIPCKIISRTQSKWT